MPPSDAQTGLPKAPDHIAIWGYGREGRSALAYLRMRYPDARFSILNDTPIKAVDGADLITGQEIGKAVAARCFDLIVKSPGVSLYKEDVQIARALGTPMTSATNLWFAQPCKGTRIVVTGTKGKSTTSALLHHLLRAGGLDAAIGGNIGVALLDLPLDKPVYVIELSSYQIADFTGRPDMAVFLNLYSEHIPWHGSKEQYFTDKSRLLALNPDATVIVNGLQQEVLERVPETVTPLTFGTDEGYHVRDGVLFYREENLGVPEGCPKGAHNLLNLAAACTVADRLGTAPRDHLDALETFEMLPHRLQELGSRDGLLFVNDSIATTPEAAIAAVSVYAERDMVLIVGGTDRSQDYDWFARELARFGNRVRGVVTLPDNGSRIAQALRAGVPGMPVEAAEDMEGAVGRARSLLGRSGVVLLSPAAPSGQAFANFEHRGRAFAASAGLADKTGKT